MSLTAANPKRDTRPRPADRRISREPDLSGPVQRPAQRSTHAKAIRDAVKALFRGRAAQAEV